METLYKENQVVIERYNEMGSCSGSTGGPGPHIWEKTDCKTLWIRVGNDVVVIRYEEREDGIGSKTKSHTARVSSVITNPNITGNAGLQG